VSTVDPFDLPDWLGTDAVTWHADRAEGRGHQVWGRLVGDAGEHPCDLFAVDQAYPEPVAGDDVRRMAHQAWRNGEVLLLEKDGRLQLAAPGTCFSADRILEVLGRLAKAVGARPDRFVAALRVGVVRTD
jgi:hypothetical protein